MIRRTLPHDGDVATLVGRAWLPEADGPSVVLVRDGALVDISATFPTISDLGESSDPSAQVRRADGPHLGGLTEIVRNTFSTRRDVSTPWLLAPVDLQPIRATGVTFAQSIIARIIDERAQGDSARACDVRLVLEEALGSDLEEVRPGSDGAARISAALSERGLWSQYLEVALGPDPEIFTKAMPLSARGTGSQVGVLAASVWNTSEPEVAITVNSRGEIYAATLANDVSLRDVEGRSALLLPKAKDYNASCAIGPFLRIFDSEFAMSDVGSMQVRLRVDAEDGFSLDMTSDMSKISRDPVDLVSALMESHQYPDGVVLLLGTMAVPGQDRDGPGSGFTHHRGDRVRISSPQLGELTNVVDFSEACEPWTYGSRALMRNLSARGLIGRGGAWGPTVPA